MVAQLGVDGEARQGVESHQALSPQIGTQSSFSPQASVIGVDHQGMLEQAEQQSACDRNQDDAQPIGEVGEKRWTSGQDGQERISEGILCEDSDLVFICKFEVFHGPILSASSTHFSDGCQRNVCFQSMDLGSNILSFLMLVF